MRQPLSRLHVLVLGLQAAVFAAACSTPPALIEVGPAGGSGGDKSFDGGGAGGSADSGGGSHGGGGTIGGSGGGGGGEADAGMALRAWIEDPGAWTPLPGQKDWDDLCLFSYANQDQIKYPALNWESCGNGCERADVNHGVFEHSAQAALSTSEEDGVALLRLGQGSTGEPTALQRVISLTSGETLAAVKTVSTGQISKEGQAFSACSGLGFVHSGIEFGAGRSFADGRDSVHLRGFWMREERTWLWQLPWQSVNERGFRTDYCWEFTMEAGGRTFWSCLDNVYGAIEPGSSVYAVIDSRGDGYVAATSGATMGELAIWTQMKSLPAGSPPVSRIRGWRPDGEGARTLLDEIPVQTCEVGVSPTHVVAFSNVGCGYGPEGRIWIARREEDDTLTDFRLGPILSYEWVAASRPSMWGEYVAVGYGKVGYENLNERGQLLLVRTSDWAMREIWAPKEHEFAVTTVTDRYIYAIPTRNLGRFSEIYRFDPEHFDELGDPVVPVTEAPPVQD